MWRAGAVDARQAKLLKSARERFSLHPLAIHVNYLINLASADPAIRAKSIEAFRGELERAAAIGAEYLVLHPGSACAHMGKACGQPIEEAIDSFATALGEASRGVRRHGLTVLLENTAGCGFQLGSRFEELHELRLRTARLSDLPLGYCLDTCHLLAAGFNVSTAAGLRVAIESADACLDLSNVHLIHANDSQAPLGSHRDRHAGIGQGHIGLEGFRRILRHPKLHSKPFILETPVEHPLDDRRNLNTLKRLAACTDTRVRGVIGKS